ncbi:unnamed protein product [Ambrosiozyma monospora]|uniref:Unnamed protein product n=1 Tax=Ambrosiozyma monospora TaxID=43982 RepID=A0A9W6T8G2_AMBMO|nr:unnamed protein product [Ambrosiozyma monospora]
MEAVVVVDSDGVVMAGAVVVGTTGAGVVGVVVGTTGAGVVGVVVGTAGVEVIGQYVVKTVTWESMVVTNVLMPVVNVDEVHLFKVQDETTISVVWMDVEEEEEEEEVEEEVEVVGTAGAGVVGVVVSTTGVDVDLDVDVDVDKVDPDSVVVKEVIPVVNVDGVHFAQLDVVKVTISGAGGVTVVSFGAGVVEVVVEDDDEVDGVQVVQIEVTSVVDSDLVVDSTVDSVVD